MLAKYPEFVDAPKGSGSGTPRSTAALPRGFDMDAMLKNPMELLKFANTLPVKAA